MSLNKDVCRRCWIEHLMRKGSEKVPITNEIGCAHCVPGGENTFIRSAKERQSIVKSYEKNLRHLDLLGKDEPWDDPENIFLAWDSAIPQGCKYRVEQLLASQEL